MLLSKSPPFNGRTPDEIMKKVEVGKWEFGASRWKEITADAKDFVTKMLTYDPLQRPNAQQIL